jgi:uncharacterized protein
MRKVNSKQEVIDTLRGYLPLLRDRFGVTEIALYGSFAKGTQRSDSDVDLVVGLSRPLGLDFVGLIQEMEELLGRPVHLTTFTTLRNSKQHPRRKRMADEVERTLSYV